jgi:excisionase family DNA binding protein
MDQRVLMLPEFCQRYRVSRTKAYEEILAGRLRVTKLGRATRICIDDAEAWLAALRRESRGVAPQSAPAA